MATHSSILARIIPWAEEPGGVTWGHKELDIKPGIPGVEMQEGKFTCLTLLGTSMSHRKKAASMFQSQHSINTFFKSQ